MVSKTYLVSRTLILSRLASHSEACCSSTSLLTASPASHVRNLAGFIKPKSSADASKKSKKGIPREGATEGNLRLQALVELLLPAARQYVPLSDTEENAIAAHKQRVAADSRAWSDDLEIKFYLQKAALKALPPRLQELAMQPDHTPFPMNRNCLFDTPPEFYRGVSPSISAVADVKVGQGRAARDGARR